LGFGCLFVGALGTPVRAQEALQSALSLDSILQTQESSLAEMPPGQPHLGPVQLSLGANSAVELNNNINLTQNNPQWDAILSAGLNLGAFWPATEQSQLNLSSGVGYAYYLRHPNDNYWDLAPGSALN
jgi:hypothetical protein